MNRRTDGRTIPQVSFQLIAENKKRSAIWKECKETRKEIANTLILFDTVYSYDGIVVDELNLKGDLIQL